MKSTFGTANVSGNLNMASINPPSSMSMRMLASLISNFIRTLHIPAGTQGNQRHAEQLSGLRFADQIFCQCVINELLEKPHLFARILRIRLFLVPAVLA